jgi:hypothetical protein
MRDPKRIKECLSLIRSVWESYPDLRLGQLIGNTFSEGSDMTDLYYIEDEDLMKRIKEMYFGGEKVEHHKPSIQTSERE